MHVYHQLLEEILNHGVDKSDRTGVGTRSIFGYQMRFDLNAGFPLMTTKELHIPSIVHELLWFLRGDTNIRYLCQNKVRIWDDWPYQKYQQSPSYQGESIKEFVKKIVENEAFAKQWGELGPVYGKQWRRWVGSDGTTVDQISDLMHQLRHSPDSRRHIVSAWNPSEISQMALPPCHCLFQFYIANDKLYCQLYQRSADVFLGVPFNIASYALLTHLIAHSLGLGVGHFVHTFGDVHLYSNHFDQARLQLSRIPYPLPTLNITCEPKAIDQYEYQDVQFINYKHYPRIKAEVAV